MDTHTAYNCGSNYLLDFLVEWLTFRWFVKLAVKPRFSAEKELH
jgi:hypothetical protein